MNRAHGLRAHFSRSRVSVASGSLQAGLAATAFGYRGALRALPATSPRALANGVTYTRGAVREWWVNGPLGLEQGFDVSARPRSGAQGGTALEIALTLSGNATPRLTGNVLTLAGAGHSLRYGGLVATDARGKALRSWLVLHGRRVSITVDDRGAVYPLRIDPFVQQANKLTPDDGGGYFGGDVALSADGNTALIGATGDNGGVGAQLGCSHGRGQRGPSKATS